MGKVNKERINALKFIQLNPNTRGDVKELNGYLVDDLYDSGLVNGIRSNELGNGSEPRYFDLVITTNGREYIESFSLSKIIIGKLHNPYIVGGVCALFGALAGVLLTTWFQ